MRDHSFHPMLLALAGSLHVLAAPGVRAVEPEILVGWRGGNSQEYPTLSGDPFPAVWVGTWRTESNLQSNLAAPPGYTNNPSLVVWQPGSGTGGTVNPYWFDGFDVSTNSSDINFELGAPRQGGPQTPTPYLANTANPSNDYHHQLFGPDAAPLQLAGDGGLTSVLVSPDLNLTNTLDGEVINQISVTLDAYANNENPEATYFTFAAISVGCATPLLAQGLPPSGFSVVLTENTFDLSGSTLQIKDGPTTLANVPNPAGSDPANIEILMYDPSDGDPWDGSGDLTAEVSVNGSLVGTFTPVASFYTDNYVTLEGNWQTFTGENDPGSNLATHSFDNLTAYWVDVGESTLPERLILADINGDGLSDKVLVFIGGDGSALLTAAYTDCSPFNFQDVVPDVEQSPTPWLQATNQTWTFGDLDGDGIDDALFTTNDIAGDALVWGGFVSDGVPGISIDQGGLTNWAGTSSWGTPSLGDRGMLGEFNGDGIADRVLHRTSDNSVYIDYGAGSGAWGDAAADVVLALGQTDDKLTVGDINGDGLDDLVLYERTNDVAGTYDVLVYYNDGSEFSGLVNGAPDLTGLWGETDGVLFGQFTVPSAVVTDVDGAAGSPGEVRVSWDSSAGCTYAVERTLDITDAQGWTEIGSVLGTGDTVTFTNSPATEAEASYRVSREAVFYVERP